MYSHDRNREIQDQLPEWLSTPDATWLDPMTTVYSNWVGTNDLGNDGFLLGGQPSGTNITTFIECNWRMLDNLYCNGGRYFVILNQAPLQHVTLYAAMSENGVGNNHYWQNKVSLNHRVGSRQY